MRTSKYPEKVTSAGTMIRKKRMDQKMSLMDVVREIKKNNGEIAESYLSRIEADKNVPSRGMTEKIAKALNLPLETMRNYIAISAINKIWTERMKELEVAR